MLPRTSSRGSCNSTIGTIVLNQTMASREALELRMLLDPKVEAHDAKKRKVSSKVTHVVTVQGLGNLIPKKKHIVKNPVSKTKRSGSGTSCIPAQHPPTQPDPTTQLLPTYQPESSQADPSLREETNVQSTQPPSSPHNQSSILIGEASHANAEIEALGRTSEPSTSQQAPPLDSLPALASTNFCLPGKVLSSSSLVYNAINQLLQL